MLWRILFTLWTVRYSFVLLILAYSVVRCLFLDCFCCFSDVLCLLARTSWWNNQIANFAFDHTSLQIDVANFPIFEAFINQHNSFVSKSEPASDIFERTNWQYVWLAVYAPNIRLYNSKLIFEPGSVPMVKSYWLHIGHVRTCSFVYLRFIVMQI